MGLTDKPELFLSVIQAHKGIIYKIANSFSHNEDDRNDLVQEIILQLWRSFHLYNGQAKYSTWIYRIALNVSISFYRKESRRRDINNPMSESILEMKETITANEIDENLVFLQQFIQELRDLDKAMMILYLEEKSYKEIADIMGISQSNVATKISRIKVLLKEKFSQIKR